LGFPPSAEVARLCNMTPTVLMRRIATLALYLCFGVVVLGAYVRLSAAGLGCPDWPGCYGHVTPIGAVAAEAAGDSAFASQPVEIGKAWREMIHRYFAATLGILIVVIAALAIQYRRQRLASVPLSLCLLVLVVAQGLLGMLTVTWQLKPLIVTGHLLLGLCTLGALFWLRQSLNNRSALQQSPPIAAMNPSRAMPLAALLAVAAQIALGGWTSSNYAATACPDFPRCQNSYWPEADYSEAFVLWRGVGRNYEGGVLELPARAAIHFAHRVGAALLTLLLAAVAALSWHRTRSSRWLLAALCLQLLLGSLMVLRGFPLWLATAHNAGAALLLLVTVIWLREWLYGRAGRSHATS
jgi:cytochrome c oxidase assembly protein subunit 15